MVMHWSLVRDDAVVLSGVASYPGLPLLAPPLEKNKGEEGLVKLIM